MSSFATSLPHELRSELSISFLTHSSLSRKFINKNNEMENTLISHLRVFPFLLILELVSCGNIQTNRAACTLQCGVSFRRLEGAVAAKCRGFQHAAKALKDVLRRQILYYRTHQW